MADDTQATVKTTEHNEASRLPEPNWFWRRWLIYGVTTWTLSLLTAVVWVALGVIPPTIHTMELIIRYSFYTMWAAVVLYGVGASVTDVAQLVSAVRTTVKVTETSAPPPAQITTSPSGASTVSTPAAAPAAAASSGVSAAVATIKGILQDKPPWRR